MNIAKTSNIYGDANTQTATLVPDLGKLADGDSLVVTADSNELKINQILDLDDSFYDTNTEEVYSQRSSAGYSVIQGNTMGWVRRSDMILEFEATFSVTASTDTNTTNCPRILGADATTTNTPNNNIAYWNLIQPEFAFLQPIIRVQCSLGENNQIIQRQQMNYLQNLLAIAGDVVYDTQDTPLYSNCGLPKSRVIRDSLTTAINTFTSLYANNSSIPVETRDYWNSIVLGIQQACVSVGGTINPVNLKFGIPLSMLNSFWQDKSYLPPNLKYRIEVEYNTALTQIMSVVNALHGAVPAMLYQNINMILSPNIRLVYRRHQLRQPLQLTINKQWLSKPFLYNYITYETIEFPFDGTTITVTQDIAISQQRPTQIIMRVTTPTLTSLALSNNATVLIYPNATVPVIYANLKIFIAGRQNYFLRTLISPNTHQDSNILLKDGTDMLNAITNNKVYLDNGNSLRFSVSQLYGTVNEGNKVIININPGDNEHIGSMSTDQGATVIRVEVDVFTKSGTITNYYGNPLAAGYKLIFYKKLPEQIQLDASKNVNIVTWPAVVSEPGYIVPNTYNMSN